MASCSCLLVWSFDLLLIVRRSLLRSLGHNLRRRVRPWRSPSAPARRPALRCRGACRRWPVQVRPRPPGALRSQGSVQGVLLRQAVGRADLVDVHWIERPTFCRRACCWPSSRAPLAVQARCRRSDAFACPALMPGDWLRCRCLRLHVLGGLERLARILDRRLTGQRDRRLRRLRLIVRCTKTNIAAGGVLRSSNARAARASAGRRRALGQQARDEPPQVAGTPRGRNASPGTPLASASCSTTPRAYRSERASGRPTAAPAPCSAAGRAPPRLGEGEEQSKRAMPKVAQLRPAGGEQGCCRLDVRCTKPRVWTAARWPSRLRASATTSAAGSAPSWIRRAGRGRRRAPWRRRKSRLLSSARMRHHARVLDRAQRAASRGSAFAARARRPAAPRAPSPRTGPAALAS